MAHAAEQCEGLSAARWSSLNSSAMVVCVVAAIGSGLWFMHHQRASAEPSVQGHLTWDSPADEAMVPSDFEAQIGGIVDAQPGDSVRVQMIDRVGRIALLGGETHVRIPCSAAGYSGSQPVIAQHRRGERVLAYATQTLHLSGFAICWGASLEEARAWDDPRMHACCKYAGDGELWDLGVCEAVSLSKLQPLCVVSHCGATQSSETKLVIEYEGRQWAEAEVCGEDWERFDFVDAYGGTCCIPYASEPGDRWDILLGKPGPKKLNARLIRKADGALLAADTATFTMLTVDQHEG